MSDTTKKDAIPAQEKAPLAAQVSILAQTLDQIDELAAKVQMYADHERLSVFRSQIFALTAALRS